MIRINLKLHLINISKFLIAAILCAISFKGISQQNDANGSTPITEPALNYDSLPKLQLKNIFISGNKKTKDYIILREMDLKPLDSLPVILLFNALEKDRQRIYNTTLFVEVEVKPVMLNAYDFDIHISVKERWYIFPSPGLKFVDGNINKWITHYKGDWDRINYGVKFVHNNLTGRKDQLTLNVLNGYTRTISFNYRAPYANRALTNGFSIGGGYYKSRELIYKTSEENDFIYYKKNDFVRTAYEINLGYTIRKALRTAHFFYLNYSHVRIDDSVVTSSYNKSYFNKPVSKIGYVDINYIIRYTDVNNVLYPLTGVTSMLGIGKRGLGFTGGINVFYIDGELNKYWSLGKKWYTSAQLRGNVKLPFKQAYINQQALGHGSSYVRGMEYKIVDGVAYGLTKFNLKHEILNFSINTIFKKSKTLNKIPFRIFAKTFADVGYSYNREEFRSRLNNKLLSSTGIGLDIVTLYDFQIRLEYSANSLGQKRLFLHNEKGF